MSKKNIDKLFQEKLKDFSETPNELVWSAISDSLDKKKSRKVIPFWWKLGGIAAAIILLFAVFNPLEDKNTIAPTITDIKNIEQKEPTIKATEANPLETNKNQIKIVNTETQEVKSNANEVNLTTNVKKQQNKNNQTNFFTTKNNSNKTTPIVTKEASKNTKNEKALAETDIKKTSENNSNSFNTIAKNDPNKLENRRPKNDLSNQKLNNESSNKSSLASTTPEEQVNKAANDNQKKSIFDEIEKQAEEKTLTNNTTSKWSVGANLAPVYFNSFGKGSSIDPSFNANSKSGTVNMSYGLTVAYNASTKLSVRTGINKVNYSYNTNEVEFSASLQGSLSNRLNNVIYTKSAANVAVGNKSENISSLANKSADVIATYNNSRNGVMAQEFGYIEVPLELDYALIENRFGVNLVGGISTLFLTNNSVVLNSSDEIIKLGEANNLNTINFSTNVGFGLNYKFSPKVRFNVEPVFKYQISTFSETSGSFNPFSIGVYSGINFKF